MKMVVSCSRHVLREEVVLQSILARLFPERPGWQQKGLFGLTIGYIVAFMLMPTGFDILYYYVPALQGEKPMYYPYWAFWIFAPLRIVPYKENYLLLILLLLFGSLLALQWTGGNPWYFLLSFPFIWVLWYGQAEGLVVLGVAVMWWASTHNRPWWFGVGLALASLKPHIVFPAAVVMWWALRTWSSRFKALWLVALLVFLSLLFFGWRWPAQWIQEMIITGFQHSYNNGSLWVWMGPWALLLWLLFLFRMPKPFQSRVRVALAISMLTMPYVPPYSQLSLYLFSMPFGMWLLGMLPFLQLVFGDGIFRFNFFVPLLTVFMVYKEEVAPAGWSGIRSP